MKEEPFSPIGNDEERWAFPRSLFMRYLKYWPWFTASIFLALFSGYLYLRYSSTIYQSTAKIKIIDEAKELDLASDALSPFAMYSKVNLDNEIEVIKSYRLLEQVVDELDLDISYHDEGLIKTRELWLTPFVVSKLKETDSLVGRRAYNIKLKPSGIYITDEDGNEYISNLDTPDEIIRGLPITVALRSDIDISKYAKVNYEVVLWPKKQTVLNLINSLNVFPANKKSEILSLMISGESPEKSEDILNVVIDKFNQDGVLDRQLVSKRTLGFIDERFVYLSGQLDSIEAGKQDFKEENDLSYLDEDVTFTLQKKSIADEEVSDLQTQLSLSRLLDRTIKNQDEYSLLPSDIGLANSSINSLVSSYNELALERSKLLGSVGPDHPSLISLNSQLERAKQNVLRTVQVYQNQIRTSLSQYNQVRDRAGEAFTRLPEKEKMLRSIERQQNIKENLFMLLLQKREEAAINYAVTAPSIKVIDYGRTGLNPISPKRIIVYPLSLFLGMVAPFLFLFLRFSLDTNLYGRSDVIKVDSETPILAEIPYLENEKSFISFNDRSELAESYRILGTNINYEFLKTKGSLGQVIYVTSAVNGEGKTLTALNLSLAYASLKKRVLLVGGDLRNPQLHKYFNLNKSQVGLSEYLNDESISWEDCIHSGFGTNINHRVCFSGRVPSNSPQLFAGNRFEEFIEVCRKNFDYIIIDTAPTILVTDTLIISKYADLTLFVLRSGKTDKRILEYSKSLRANKKLPNMAYVINNVGIGNFHDYNYGYAYGYGKEMTNPSQISVLIKKIKHHGITQKLAKFINGLKSKIKKR